MTVYLQNAQGRKEIEPGALLQMAAVKKGGGSFLHDKPRKIIAAPSEFGGGGFKPSTRSKLSVSFKQSSEKAKNHYSAFIKDEAGLDIGNAYVVLVDGGKEAHILSMGGVDLKPNKLGPAAMRQLLRGLKRRFPTVERVTGKRSLAREAKLGKDPLGKGSLQEITLGKGFGVPEDKIPETGKRRVVDVELDVYKNKGLLYGQKTVEVTVNPSKRDIMKLLKEVRGDIATRGNPAEIYRDIGEALRFTTHPDTKELYVWKAGDAVHPDIGEALRLPAVGESTGFIWDVKGKPVARSGFGLPIQDLDKLLKAAGETVGKVFGVPEDKRIPSIDEAFRPQERRTPKTVPTGDGTMDLGQFTDIPGNTLMSVEFKADPGATFSATGQTTRMSEVGVNLSRGNLLKEGKEKGIFEWRAIMSWDGKFLLTADASQVVHDDLLKQVGARQGDMVELEIMKKGNKFIFTEQGEELDVLDPPGGAMDNPLIRDLLGKKTEPEPTPTIEEAFGPTGKRAELSKEALEAFASVTSTQRGRPELAMTEVLGSRVAPELDNVLEHIGDLTHVLTNEAPYGSFRRERVLSKIQGKVQTLENPNLRKFIEENHESLSRFKSEPVDAIRDRYYKLMQQYADEHKKVPVFNRPQKLARDAAVAVGERQFGKAAKLLRQLEKIAQDPTGFQHAASQFKKEPPTIEKAFSPKLIEGGKKPTFQGAVKLQEKSDFREAAEKLLDEGKTPGEIDKLLLPERENMDLGEIIDPENILRAVNMSDALLDALRVRIANNPRMERVLDLDFSRLTKEEIFKELKSIGIGNTRTDINYVWQLLNFRFGEEVGKDKWRDILDIVQGQKKPTKGAKTVEMAHSAEGLADLTSISQGGLRPDTSIEPAADKAFAAGTFRLIFDADPETLGRSVARAFAKDMPFTKTEEIVPAKSIKRIEVDVDNLPPAPLSEKAAEAKFDAIIKRIKRLTPMFNDENQKEWDLLFTQGRTVHSADPRIKPLAKQLERAMTQAEETFGDAAPEIHEGNYREVLRKLFGDKVKITEIHFEEEE